MVAAGIVNISARAACLRQGCSTPLVHAGTPLAIIILVACAAMLFFSIWSNNRTYTHWRQNEGATWDPESGPPPNPPKYRGTRGRFHPSLVLFALVAGATGMLRGISGITALPTLVALAIAGASLYAYAKNRSRTS